VIDDAVVAVTVAAVPPIVTVPPDKFVPLIVMLVPPAVVPLDGVIDVIVGNGAVYVNAPGKVPVPFAVVTATSTAPAACTPVVAVIEVAELLTTVAATPPIVTAVALSKFVPVIVTLVPPDVPPDEGLTVVIEGGTAEPI